jgi:hypothetical protein
MRGSWRLLRQEMTNKLLQSEVASDGEKKYAATWRKGPVCTIMH